MRSKLSFALTALIVCATIVTLGACNRNRTETAQKDRALVRFVNATSYQEPVALYLDKNPVIPDVAPDRVSQYTETDAKRHTVEVRAKDQTAPAATNSESFTAGDSYTIVGFNKRDGTPAVGVFADKRDEPAAGKARIRVIHVADGAEDLDVYPAGSKDALVESVDFNSANYVDVDPGVQSLEIKREGETVVSLTIDNLSLTPGRTETIIVEADANQMLHAIRVQDATSVAETREGRMSQKR
jgi:hypothetical protein